MIPYDQNNNPNARYSNAKLNRHASIQLTFVTLFFGVLLMVSYALSSQGHTVGLLSLLFFWLGCGLGLFVFFATHLMYGKKKRAEFISAGGDPNGITLFMFGAMGGKLLPDGTWQWNSPGGSGGDGVYSGDGGGGDGGGGD